MPDFDEPMHPSDTLWVLKKVLSRIVARQLDAERADPDDRWTRESLYKERNALIFHAAGYATEVGFRAWLALDPKEPAWIVVFIKLPTGQVSWHMPPWPDEWDGHITEEKHARIDRFMRWHPGDPDLSNLGPMPEGLFDPE